VIELSVTPGAVDGRTWVPDPPVVVPVVPVPDELLFEQAAANRPTASAVVTVTRRRRWFLTF
jgi:hypothetical protein